jgi:hypothetical protein
MRRNDAELEQELLEILRGEAKLDEEDNAVDDNEHPGHDGRIPVRNGAADWDHDLLLSLPVVRDSHDTRSPLSRAAVVAITLRKMTRIPCI